MKTKARSRIKQRGLNRKQRLTLYTAILGILIGLFLASRLSVSATDLDLIQRVSAPQDPTIQYIETVKEVIKEQPRENIDTYIGDAVDEFLPKHKSEARMIMHCLAHRENGHGANPNAHGDNGKAGGPFQFWQDTWVGYRKLMIKEGKASEIGSRYDFKEAARTTAWAINSGRSEAWGPLLRDKNGNDFASCQYPSWQR